MGCEIVVAILFLFVWIAVLCGVTGAIFAVLGPVPAIVVILFTIFVFMVLATS